MKDGGIHEMRERERGWGGAKDRWRDMEGKRESQTRGKLERTLR